MSPKKILEIFNETGALLKGHFQLTSGLHSSHYLQCALVLQYPRYASRLCSEIARRFRDEGIETVIAPAVGGIVVAQEVARLLKVRAVFSEREEGEMRLRRGFKIKRKEKVLVVEDVLTTGGSLQETIELVKDSGGEIKGVGMLVDRSGGRVELGLPREALLVLDLENYEPGKCPLCEQGIPLEKPGSRKVKV